MSETLIPPTLTRKDFVTSQEVRWCPGCGDYAILAAMQKFLPELGVPLRVVEPGTLPRFEMKARRFVIQS